MLKRWVSEGWRLYPTSPSSNYHDSVASLPATILGMNAMAPPGEGPRALLGGGRCELHGRRPDSATLLCCVLEVVEALRQPQHGSMDAILPHPGVLIEYSCADARFSWNMSTGSRDVVRCDPVEGVETIARLSQSFSCVSRHFARG